MVAQPISISPPGLPLTPQQVIVQAQQWLGTPYHHRQWSRWGCDCVGLLIGLAQELGVDLGDPRLLPAYSQSWHLYRAENLLEETLATLGLQHKSLDCRQPGDIVAFRFGRPTISHVGILVAPARVIHTRYEIDSSPDNCVKETDMRHDHDLASRLQYAYAFPGVV